MLPGTARACIRAVQVDLKSVQANLKCVQFKSFMGRFLSKNNFSNSHREVTVVQNSPNSRFVGRSENVGGVLLEGGAYRSKRKRQKPIRRQVGNKSETRWMQEQFFVVPRRNAALLLRAHLGNKSETRRMQMILARGLSET